MPLIAFTCKQIVYRIAASFISSRRRSGDDDRRRRRLRRLFVAMCESSKLPCGRKARNSCVSRVGHHKRKKKRKRTDRARNANGPRTILYDTIPYDMRRAHNVVF